jgi:hypothetical protein
MSLKLRPPAPRPRRTGALVAALAIAIAISVAAAQEPEPIASIASIASIDSVRVVEGDSGTVTAVFTVRLSHLPDLQDAVLEYATESRTATAGSDFLPASGTLYLSSLEQRVGRQPRVLETPDPLVYQIPVTVLGDSLVEGNEWFALRLVAGGGVAIVDSIGSCVIVNDERPRFVMDWMGVPFACGPLAPAFADLDGDGDTDTASEINLGNAQFADFNGVISLLLWGEHHGIAWGDYNKDGLPDLIVMPYDTDWGPGVKAHLLRNDGFGAFNDVAPTLGMDLVGNGETPVWGDFDGDGWPDLFAPYYAHVPPHRSFFYRNRGDGTFEERAAEAGIDLSGVPESLKPEGADAVDWDGNGTLDLYCASHLFLNDGTGHFTDVRAQVGLPEVFDEGSRFVDLDNDGDFDFFLRTEAGPRLFRNQSGHYSEIFDSGLPAGPWFWGDSWADADNDGDLDLLMAISSGSFDLWLNQGTGTFVKEFAFTGTNDIGTLSAWADVDSDGDLDGAIGINSRAMLLNHTDEMPHEVNNVLRVQVLDTDSTATSYGATVRLRELSGGPGSIQTRTVNGGAGYLTQDEYTLHFAGLSGGRYALEVRWPGSLTTATVVDGSINATLANLDPRTFPDRTLRIYRNGIVEWGNGQGPLAVGEDAPGVPSRLKLLGSPSPMPARSSVRLPLWRADLPNVVLTIRDLTGRRVRELTTYRVGDSALTWDLRDGHGQAVASGVYFARLTVAGQPAGDQRIVVVR